MAEVTNLEHPGETILDSKVGILTEGGSGGAINRLDQVLRHFEIV